MSWIINFLIVFGFVSYWIYRHGWNDFIAVMTTPYTKWYYRAYLWGYLVWGLVCLIVGIIKIF